MSEVGYGGYDRFRHDCDEADTNDAINDDRGALPGAAAREPDIPISRYQGTRAEPIRTTQGNESRACRAFSGCVVVFIRFRQFCTTISKAEKASPPRTRAAKLVRD